MGAVLLALLSGVVLPLLVIVMKRHYDANPNEWEQAFLVIAVGLVGIVIGVWIISLEPFSEGSWGRLIVGILAYWSVVIGGGILVGGGSQAIDLLRKTRAK